ncbi:tetratricopeptide repeat protein [Eikenella sp. Marseille-P7795]|uniref:tetratricopeptide repeat protein n=1 Tax=Eikenella sp. Marseille-P7795 TaxID=2866577 RepID=UPI001CE40763|nr:tetratricopeptide repeat protein [Eikenella sp. Marseille-P7795]
MKNYLTAVLLAVYSAAALAVPYPPLNPESLVSGSPEHPPITVNLPALRHAFDNLAVHAGSYPIHFDNDADRRRAIADLRPIGVLLDSLIENNTPRPGTVPHSDYLSLLQMRARLNWMGHNLDQPGYAYRAEADYNRLLTLAPAAAKPAIQGEFGAFFASSARTERAIPLLRAAYQAGHKERGLDLATALLTQNKRSEALPLLREYARRFPQDPRGQAILNAVEHGSVETHTSYPSRLRRQPKQHAR